MVHTAIHCNTLQHTATHVLRTGYTDGRSSVHCIVMQHATQCSVHCKTLQDTATHCNIRTKNRTHRWNEQCTLHRDATQYKTKQHTETHYDTLQLTLARCNTRTESRECMLQHITTHHNTLWHTATHCNTLQHTATHCNTRTESRAHGLNEESIRIY